MQLSTDGQMTLNDLSCLLTEIDHILASPELSDAYWETIVQYVEEMCHAEE